jgi:tRNA (mo5U34)-methyltransferase
MLRRRSSHRVGFQADSIRVICGMNEEIEARILAARWFYQFILPSGRETVAYGPQKLHADRLRMMWQAIKQRCGSDFASLSATDIACHQGWFSHHLAAGGFGRVVGVDPRPEHVADAELMRSAFELPKLKFINHSVFDPAVASLEPSDLVLMYGLLYHLEDPIGALRIASKLTKQLLLIETQVMPTDLIGHIDWGSHQNQIALQGSFGLIYEPDEHNLETGISGLALVPSTGVLVWLLRQFGFTSVEVLAPPPDGHEQLTSGKRVVIAAAR